MCGSPYIGDKANSQNQWTNLEQQGTVDAQQQIADGFGATKTLAIALDDSQRSGNGTPE